MSQVEEEADEDEFQKVITEEVDDEYFEFSSASADQSNKNKATKSSNKKEERQKKEVDKAAASETYNKLEPQTVILKVVQGKIFVDTEMFGQMDPYIEIIHAGQLYKTVLAKNGGQRPIWNSSLEIPKVNIENDVFQIRCLESDFLQDDFIGSTIISVS